MERINGMRTINTINSILYIALTVLYFYQFIYIVIALIGDKKKKLDTYEAKKLHKFAFIIAARNEQAVIGNLINSIKQQNYPAELIDVIVVADNCTDDTAQIAREHGAICYERFNNMLVGKGYALDYCFNKIVEQFGDYTAYDGYFIFDADNVIDKNYVKEMNKVFDRGYNVITSYRNSKNYDTNWITSGYSLWFIREAKYLNNPRMMLKTSCAVSGTGFLVNSSIIKKNNGWKFNLLTEDIQFSVVNILEGEKIGYCESAVTYDEEPVTWRASLVQRRRWMSGIMQVSRLTLPKLFRNFLRRPSLNRLDGMLQLAFPFLQALTPFFTLAAFLAGSISLQSLPVSLLSAYAGSLTVAAAALVLEKRLDFRLTGGILLYPVFMACFLPLQTLALFKTQTVWHEIRHSGVRLASPEFQLRRKKIA